MMFPLSCSVGLTENQVRTLRPLMIFVDDFCRWSRTFTLVLCG